MDNSSKNDAMMAFTEFIQLAGAMATAQKVYFDACLKNGFDHDDALLMTIHYNPMIYGREATGSSGPDEEGDY